MHISIHALLAESDHARVGVAAGAVHFYPRSPCGERQNFFKIDSVDRDFYPRSPCGERPLAKRYGEAVENISIHALLAESDRGWCFISAFPQTFLSTLSLRRATDGLRRW